MSQVPWVQAGILLGEKFFIKNQSPIRHNIINIGVFLSLWLAIILVWFGSFWIPFWAFIPLGALALGYLHYCQLILVAHEAGHGMFIISKNPSRTRSWNNFFGWLVCIPFSINFTRHWKNSHHAHHKYTLEAKDTFDCDVSTHQALVKKLAKLLLIPGYLQIGASLTGKSTEFKCAPLEKDYPYLNWKCSLAMTLFWSGTLLLFWTIFGLNGFIVAAAIFYGTQVMGALNVTRQTLEHGGAIGKHPNPFLRTRSTLSKWKILLAPINSSYHFEHHLHPRVPWYALGNYSKELEKVIPEPLKSILYNDHQVLRQLAGQLPGIPIPSKVHY